MELENHQYIMEGNQQCSGARMCVCNEQRTVATVASVIDVRHAVHGGGGLRLTMAGSFRPFHEAPSNIFFKPRD